jgi:purine-binding chemotaxis protein CheW
MSETGVKAESKKDILRQRAKALARVPQREEDAREMIDAVEFGIAGETWAIETAFVREVYPLKDLTTLPNMPAFIYGIINVRGQIVSVMDIKKLFALKGKGLADLHQVMIARHGGIEVGILVDEVIGLRSINPTELGPPLSTMTGSGAEYVRGVTKEALILIDAGTMLADPRIVVEGGRREI